MTEPLRIGNCSGFYGDRLSAMREQLEGGELDVLTGDYLAELTMLILGKDTMKDPSLGYARTFVTQVEDCLGLALEQGVRIVSNAGGLNPAGLADRLREVARGLGLDPAIAHVEGDDLRPLGRWEGALTANAYLGGFGIAAALREGADVVVTGRVTDASLVVGPAAAHHGWDASSYDALAGAVVAGHVIECGTQATGGNFSGFLDLPGVSGRYGGARGESGATTQYGSGSGRETTRLSGNALGFPVAEVAADGSSVITKHDGTGGAVTVDTVTAQLVYEIQSTRYLGPDVTALLDTVSLDQHGPDRVQITGVRGEAPPERLKVCLNELGGWRNSAELVLTGLDLDAKEAWVRDQLEAAWGDRRPETVAWSRSAAPEPEAGVMDRGYSLLRCTVLDPDPKVAGKGLTGPLVELALGSYPGFTLTAPPSPATPYGVYRPEYVERSAVEHTVVHADGRREVVGDPPVSTLSAGTDSEESAAGASYPDRHNPPRDAETSGERPVDQGLCPFDYDHARLLPLGTFVHARSGDKGGDANLGLWVRHDGDDARRERRLAWLLDLVTPDRVRELLSEARDLDVDVHQLPNLGGVNVVVHGLLGLGVAASTRVDPQAKALGELVRARRVPIPEELL